MDTHVRGSANASSRCMRKKTIFAVAVAALVGACAHKETSSSTAQKPAATLHAASYDVTFKPGDPPAIHVEVWSMGAKDVDGRTYVHLAMRVRNMTDRNIMIDPQQIALDTYRAGGMPLREPEL